MATFSFEGQHKSKLIQDYRGSNRTEDAASLIRRNREDRLKRQTQRLQNEAATTIQSFVRGSLSRSQQIFEKFPMMRRYTRDLFDGLHKDCCSETPSASNLMSMIRSLNCFYNQKMDAERLKQLCALLVSPACRHNLDEWLRFDQSEFRFALGRFLYLVVCYLSSLPPGEDSRSYSMSLRLLEITFEQTDAAVSASSCHNLGLLLSFLARKGYFLRLSIFFCSQTPTESFYDFSAFSRLPRVESLLKLFSAPLKLSEKMWESGASANDLQILAGVSSTTVASEVIRALLRTLYSPEDHLGYKPTAKVLQVLSGSVAASVPPRTLLAALLKVRNTGQQPHAGDKKKELRASDLLLTQIAVPETVGLLHLLTKWMLPQQQGSEEMSPELCYLLLLVLAPLVTSVLSPVWATNGVKLISLHEGDDDDDDEEGRMEVEETSVELVEAVEALKAHGADVLKRAFTILEQDKGNEAVTTPLVYATCRLFYGLMIQRRESLIHYTSFLHVIGECPGLLSRMWSLCLHLVDDSGGSLLDSYTHPGGQNRLRADGYTVLTPVMATFACCFHHRLLALHDGEFLDAEAVGFPGAELVRMSAVMRDTVLGMIELAHPDTRPELNEDYKKILERLQRREMRQRGDEQSILNSAMELIQTALDFEHVQRLTLQLYHRDRRRKYCPEGHWTRPSVADSIRLDQHSWLRRQMQSKDVPPLKRVPFGYYSVINANKRMEEEESPAHLSTREARQVTILTELPFVIPFSQRVRIFYTLVEEDRNFQQGNFENQHLYSAIAIRVRRSHLYEDSFEKLSKEKEPSLRLRLKVEFMNAAGAFEPGVDGGGLSREFLGELLLKCFDPKLGFFVYAEDKTLYPNPAADVLAEDFRRHYFFMGRMLAKAIYEGLLVELNFANFFLAKVLSRVRGNVEIDYLQYLDPDLYKNLLSLKTYEGDVQDLALDFTIVNSGFGGSQVTELKPGGSNILVTAENRVEYIHLVAYHKLNRQIRPQVDSFVAGLNDVVPIDWLRMFDAQELQVVISGANTPIDLTDLRKHTRYVGCSEDDPTIRAFWEVMESFSEVSRRRVLKFVTSCSRPPLFGFEELYPPFTVQLTPETDRLPSASTCVNLLKLPNFKETSVVRQKLDYVIESGAGFELS